MLATIISFGVMSTRNGFAQRAAIFEQEGATAVDWHVRNYGGTVEACVPLSISVRVPGTVVLSQHCCDKAEKSKRTQAKIKFCFYLGNVKIASSFYSESSFLFMFEKCE